MQIILELPIVFSIYKVCYQRLQSKMPLDVIMEPIRPTKHVAECTELQEQQ